MLISRSISLFMNIVSVALHDSKSKLILICLQGLKIKQLGNILSLLQF